MFMLTSITDTVRVDPASLGLATATAVEQEIGRLYFDKVIRDVGLVISLYDINSTGLGSVHSGDGGAHYLVSFRLVVFRPYEGEVILGKIAQSTACDSRKEC
jgi:DNA-directed RNA polymerase subunit E'/Rpb7